MGLTKVWGGPALWLTFAILLAGCGGDGGGEGDDDIGPPPSTPNSFTLSGTLLAASGTNVDGDVNDPNADYRPNDAFFEAQPIPNPVTLGGYASVVPFGPPSSRFAATTDPQDWFQVELAVGQNVSLFAGGDNRPVALTLSLHRPNGDILDVATGAFPTLEAPDTGEYLILVQATQGASNYILTVGREPLAGDFRRGPRLSDSFVAGQVVVRYRQEALASLAVSDPAAPLGRRRAGDPTTGSVLVELDPLAVNRSLGQMPASPDPITAAKLATLQAVEALNRDPAVEWAEPNYLARTAFVPPDRLYPRQWHYPLINLPQAWDLTQGRRFDNGEPVIVAVVDTGIVSDHPDLRGQITQGYDFISDPARAQDGDGIDPDPRDPGDRSEPDGSSSFHGTHVAGIVAARASNPATVNGETVPAFGVVGSAFAAQVMPLRVLGRLGEGTFFD
ncbi:MAG: S8 family serine peptidase, partial [Candidatus Competibacteraceae bacterium]|nr:S8 family serine peptidase [Candidatus Competibacteraceae bacterium]